MLQEQCPNICQPLGYFCGDLFWGIFSEEKTISVAAAERFIKIDWQIAPQNQTL